jgi:hypothetical protein
MPLIAAAAEAAATRRRASSDGTGFWHTTYLGTNRYRPDAAPPPAQGALYAMAFLVEQDPGSTVRAHFHQADQFQVVLAGDGTLGTHAVAPVAVHFTAAHSAYGPIRAGAAGLTYFTLRNGWDPGARYMPEARAALPRPRRHREAVGPAPAPTAPTAARRVPVLAAAPDGLAAWHHHLPAGAPLTGPGPAADAGHYWLVVAGSLHHGSAELGPWSCMFVTPGEPAPAAHAGAAGAALLSLHFPCRGEA